MNGFSFCVIFAFFVAISEARRIPLGQRAGVGQAPLDINNEIGGTLNTLSALVGTLGHSASGLVMGLTGISITDCAGSLKDKDLNKMPCDEFLETLSQCDSLANIKDLLQKAKKNYQKNPNKKAPCFKNKAKKKKSG